ncbi:MAG: ATP-binding protein [Candidatus Omnitrophota bacterium]
MLSEPAVGKAFFGREEVMRTLEKRVNALKGGYRQNVALAGQMLAGKSSILYQFLYNLKDTSLIPVYIEVVEEVFSSFVDRFIATLLYSYLSSCSREPQKDLPNLMKESEPLIPHTIYAIKRVKSELQKKNYNTAYDKILNLTSILKKESGKSCVVILDEFHNLEFFKIKKPFLHFGKIIMIQKDTMYIVSSSQKSTIKKILSEKLALLYGNFEIIEVSGFDHKTAEAFLREKMGNICLEQNSADYLIDFTDGNPFYLDVLAKKIVEIANSAKISSAGENTVIEAFTASLYNTSGTINQYFTNNIMNLLERDLRQGHLDVLIALALGHNKLCDIARWFGKKNTAGFSVKLARLIELDMVYKNGVFYGIHEGVFGFWLRTVYHRRKTSLVDDVVSRANDFKAAVKNDIADYRRESQKDILERIKELFLLFNGETVEIEKKYRKLPRFVKIEAQEYSNCTDLVSYQKPNRYWICEIWRDRVEETNVSDFIGRYHPMRERIVRKICIALEGIDANALLLAKEKNVWVWNLKNTNNLLRLYKRHNLIQR